MRRPLPMRVREVAHILGMGVILFLMGIAFKNDIQKRVDTFSEPSVPSSSEAK